MWEWSGAQYGRPESRTGLKRCATPWTRCEDSSQGEVEARKLPSLDVA